MAVAESTNLSKSLAGRFTHWLLKNCVEEPKGSGSKERLPNQHPRWQVVCLTGVNYFSTLGHILATTGLAARALSPITALLFVVLALLGMLPMYRRVAENSWKVGIWFPYETCALSWQPFFVAPLRPADRERL